MQTVVVTSTVEKKTGVRGGVPHRLLTLNTATDRLLRSAAGSKLAYSPSLCAKNSAPPTSSGATEDGSLVLCIADTYLGSVATRDSARAPNHGPRAFMWADSAAAPTMATGGSGRPSLFVAFRGTVGMRDALDTLDARTDRYGFCGRSVRVHAGMLGAFSEMEGELTDAILGSGEFDGIPASLTFAGHSKGGGHAQFAAAYYSSMLGPRCRVSCHTFGAPRVGDDAFAEWYSEGVAESVVMIDRRDPVARLPPEFAGYHGTGALAGTRLFDDGGLHGCPLLELGHHDMDSYLEHVSRVMGAYAAG